MADLSHLTPEQRARYEAYHARMLAAFPYERVTVPGTQALAEWKRLRRAGRGQPVVIGGDDSFERLADQFTMLDPVVSGVTLPGEAPPQSPAALLEDAARLPYPDCLSWSGSEESEDRHAPVGDWPAPDGVAGAGFTIASDLQARPLDRVHLLLLPAQASWEVPAFLRWGGWNACPPPENHVAALRHWHERYGAELVGIDGDTINMRVVRRPASREEALALARDQYRYCPDIVDQGVQTLSALAATLMASDWWYFWWD